MSRDLKEVGRQVYSYQRKEHLRQEIANAKPSGRQRWIVQRIGKEVSVVEEERAGQ